MADWCRRCGGPLRDGACANCSYAAGHPPAPQGPKIIEREVIHARDVREWIASIADIEPYQDPMEALFVALLPNVGDELEVETSLFSARIALGERTLDLPRGVAMLLLPLLDLGSAKQKPAHSGFGDQHLQRLRKNGMWMPVLEHLSIVRTRSGFSVKRV